MTGFFNEHKRPIGVMLVFGLLVAGCFAYLSGDIHANEGTTKNKKSSTESAKTTDPAVGKDEVVYANMDPSGNVRDIFIVNVLEVDNSEVATDYGHYNKVVNLTDTTDIDQDGDKITVNTDPGKFYYEGYGEKNELPWNIDIDYYLDGNKVSSSNLAGESGELKIKIDTHENPHGNSLFYENYMLQISIPLDMDVADNIESEGGSEALSGNTKLINYAVLPGNDGDFVLTADVSEFEMDGIQINGIPFSMDYDLGELDDMMDEFDTLVDAADRLASGYDELDSGIGSLDSGTNDAKKGSSKINSGLKTISKATSKLSRSSSKINKGIQKMSKSLSSSLNADDIGTMLKGIENMAVGLKQISSAMTYTLDGLSVYKDMIPRYPTAALDQLRQSGQSYAEDILKYAVGARTFLDAYDQYSVQAKALATSVGAMGTSLKYISDEMEDLDEIAKLQTGLTSFGKQYKKFNKYLQSYFDGVNNLATEYGKMNSGISSLSSAMSRLASGSTDYAGGIGIFASSVSDIPGTIQEKVDGLVDPGDDFETESFVSSKNKNINSVQFVVSTDKIKLKKVTKQEAGEAEGAQSILDKIWRLFNIVKRS